LGVALIAAPTSLHGQSTSGALKVTSFPSDANVSIDGVATGKVLEGGLAAVLPLMQ
jgi:hypothetical protein